MTVAVGFMCTDGIVLAADREVSTASLKIDGPKVWYFRYPPNATHPVLRVGVAGAGDYAFIKYASELIDRQLRDWVEQHGQATMDEVNAIVQGVINDIHHNHLYPIGQPHERPNIDLLIGISISDGRIRLARSSLTSITNVCDYEAVGIGSDLANFIVKRSYKSRVTVTNAVFWAAQVLMHAKHYVPGCGGSSDVVVLFKGFGAGLVKQNTISNHERFLNDFESVIQPVLFGGANPTVDDQAFAAMVDDLAVRLKALRNVGFIQKQAEQVRQDIKIEVPTGSVTVTGEWISPAIRKTKRGARYGQESGGV